jgi:hypothetical protein
MERPGRSNLAVGRKKKYNSSVYSKRNTDMGASNEVMFYSDGRHTSVYLYEPPMGKRQYVEPIDELVDLGIDTITYAVGDCTVLLYATEVGERWGHNVDLTDHDIWWRAAHNARLMIESGVDPLMLVCEHAQAKGFQFLPALLLNMGHTAHGRVTNCRVADFTTDHPEWQVGEEPDFPEAKHDSPSRLTYAQPEVRANRLAVINELVSKYPSDGIELNMADYAPFIARREVAEHTETMTGWMREIRAACDGAAKAQNRAKRVVIRAGASLAGNLGMGMDLAGWIKEGIVDSVVGMQVVGGFENDASGLRELVSAAEGTDVTVLAGMEATNHPELSTETVRAAASNAYAAGVKGVFFHTFYPVPKRYPYDDAAAGVLRFMGHPDLLAHKDKRYWLGIAKNPNSAPQNGLTEQLPVELKPDGQGPEISLEVGDEVAEKSRLGELWRCELRVMLQHLTYEDEIRFVWNGEEISSSDYRKADWTYNLRPHPGYAINGYRLHADLKGIGKLPKAGKNTIRVDVLKKDPQLVHNITIADVDLKIEYLPHRNAVREDDDYFS